MGQKWGKVLFAHDTYELPHMRTRRAIRHSGPASYKVKIAYVGEVTDSSRVKLNKRLLQANLRADLLSFIWL